MKRNTSITPMQEPLLAAADSSDEPMSMIHSRNVSMASIDLRDVPRTATINSENTEFMNNRVSTSRYNLLSFVPKTVFMQFRRLANVYFLLQSILMWIGTNYPEIFTSPLSPGSTVGPLLVIVFLTCVKEGLEDLKRHRSDSTTNGKQQHVLRPRPRSLSSDSGMRTPEEEEEEEMTTKKVIWKNVRVGQYVLVRDKEQLPADVVVVCSSNGDGCFIETSNIDGETNLKIREVPLKIFNFLEKETEVRRSRRRARGGGGAAV